jgi:hypothetical protein
MGIDIDKGQYTRYIDVCRYREHQSKQKEVPRMLDRTTAAWMIERVDAQTEREAVQRADLREAQTAYPTTLQVALQRVKAIVRRDSANECDGAAA